MDSYEFQKQILAMLQKEDWSGIDPCLGLIRKQKNSDPKDLPSICSVLKAMYPDMGDLNAFMRMEQSYFRIIPESGHELIRLLYQLGAQEFAAFENLEPSLLFFPGARLDAGMVRTLLSHGIDFEAPRNRGIYDLLLTDYLYLVLTDWEGLSDCSGTREQLLLHLEQAAAETGLPRPNHLRLLLDKGAPSLLTGFPVRFDKMDLVLKSRQEEYGIDFMLEANDNAIENATLDDANLFFALTASGQSWVFTCGCGDPNCGGFWTPVTSRILGKIARWRVPQPFRYFCFDRLPVLRQFAEGLRQVTEAWRNHPASNGDTLHGPYGTELENLEKLQRQAAALLCKMK